MEAIIDYFTNMPSIHRTILLVGGLSLFWLIESTNPFYRRNYNTLQHALVNIFFTLTTAIVNLPLAFLLVISSDWAVANHFGLLQLVSIPAWLILLIGLPLMDLIGAWLIHYIQHHVAWMWKFHAIHHTDQHLDVTSGNRHHPGESVFRYVFTLLAVLMLGAPMWLVFLYQTLSVVLTQFNHSNVTLPTWINRSLGLFLVTPEMHRVHHHYRMPYSDMNYGNIFPFWDKIFGTFIKVDNSKIVFGLDTHMSQKESGNIWEMLKIPFKTYKQHIAYDEEEKL